MFSFLSPLFQCPTHPPYSLCRFLEVVLHLNDSTDQFQRHWLRIIHLSSLSLHLDQPVWNFRGSRQARELSLGYLETSSVNRHDLSGRSKVSFIIKITDWAEENNEFALPCCKTFWHTKKKDRERTGVIHLLIICFPSRVMNKGPDKPSGRERI